MLSISKTQGNSEILFVEVIYRLIDNQDREIENKT